MNALSCIITATNEVALLPGHGSRAVGAGEIRIRTIYSLISPGTELAIFLGQHIGLPDPTNLFAKYPFAAGYAAVGEVIELGAGVSDVERGELVYFQGAHESVAVVDRIRANVRPVPPNIDPKLAPFARLAQIAYTGVHMANLAGPATVAVVGLGLIGNLAAQLFSADGHTVIAADTLSARRTWAAQCGIEHLVATNGPDLAANLRSAAGQGGIDACIECTGVPALAQTCLEVVRDRGKVVLLGSPRGKAEIDIYNHIHRTGVSLIGAHERLIDNEPGVQPSRCSVADDMLVRIGTGALVVEPLLTRIAKPEELSDCYRMLDRDKEHALGVLIDWTDTPQNAGTPS